MKYINKLTWLLVLGAGLMTASCSDSDDVDIPGGLSIDKEQIEIGAQGGSEQLAIAASQNWVANVDEPWLMAHSCQWRGFYYCNCGSRFYSDERTPYYRYRLYRR